MSNPRMRNIGPKAVSGGPSSPPAGPAAGHPARRRTETPLKSKSGRPVRPRDVVRADGEFVGSGGVRSDTPAPPGPPPR